METPANRSLYGESVFPGEPNGHQSQIPTGLQIECHCPEPRQAAPARLVLGQEPRSPDDVTRIRAPVTWLPSHATHCHLAPCHAQVAQAFLALQQLACGLFGTDEPLLQHIAALCQVEREYGILLCEKNAQSLIA